MRPASSTSLTVPSGWTVRATATGGRRGPGLAVLLGGPAPPISASPPSPARARPGCRPVQPPAGTKAVAVVGDEVDAFVPSGATLRIWASSGGGPWHLESHLTVPIQYGSSS